MDDLGLCNERLRDAFALGYRGVAEALLSNEEPDARALGLLYIAVVDAAMAGDKEVLACVPMVVVRLFRYLPEAEPWSDDWRGRLWGLDSAAAFAACLLVLERDAPPASP